MAKHNTSKPFPRNIHFTRLVKTGGKLKEFNFRKRNIGESPFYDVDTSDERGNRFTFIMEQTGQEWKIRNRLLPNWILEVEPLLEKVILEQETGEQS